MKRQHPYQSSDNGKYWDYNFKIKGTVFEISVDKESGEMFIDKDEMQEVKLGND